MADIRTRSIIHHNYKENVSLCRLCGEGEEKETKTLVHLVQEPWPEHKKWRQNKMVQVIHWLLSKTHDLEHTERPQKVTGNESDNLLGHEDSSRQDPRLCQGRFFFFLAIWEIKSCKIISLVYSFDTRAEGEGEEILEPEIGTEVDL